MIFAVYIPYNIAFGVVVGKYKRFLILHLLIQQLENRIQLYAESTKNVYGRGLNLR